MHRVLALSITIEASTVAWYGAIVATVSAVVGIYNALRDRARLKIRARTNMVMITEGLEPTELEERYIVIEVANVGRRPVHLATLPWFTVKGTDACLMVKGHWNPKRELNEGESAWMQARQASVTLKLSELYGVVVRDATGRLWKGRVAHQPAGGGKDTAGAAS